MDIQFVFAKNPTIDKSFGKKKKNGKIREKGKATMKHKKKKKLSDYPKNQRKLIQLNRKRARDARAKNRKPKKRKSAKKSNPQYSYKKGNETKRGIRTESASMRKKARAAAAKGKKRINELSRQVIKAPISQKGHILKKVEGARAKLAKTVAKLEAKLSQEKVARRAQAQERRAMLSAGYTANYHSKEKGASTMAKKKKKKAKAKHPKKRKKAKAKHPKKKKKSRGKKRGKKARGKKRGKKARGKKRGRKARGKKRGKKARGKKRGKKVRHSVSKRDHKAIAFGRRAAKARKGSVVKYGRKKFKRTNPIFKGANMKNVVKDYLGLDNKEATSMLVGGMLHSAANGLLLKVPYASKLVGIPVIGPTVLPLLAGILAKKYGGKSAAVEVVSDGLIAASIVGIGVQLAQMIPGLKAPMAGLMIGPNLNFDGMGSFRYFPKTSMAGPEDQLGGPENQMGEQGNFYSTADLGGNWQSESMT